MSDTPNPFWDELSKRRKKAGLSESELARQLNVTAQTFSSWKSRGQFRRSLLPRLSEILFWPLTPEKVNQKGGQLVEDRKPIPILPDRHPIEDVLNTANRAYHHGSKAFARYAAITPQLIGALDSNCFFAFSSCTTSPYEFEETPVGHRLMMEIAKAISRGALFLYLRPTAVGIRYFEEEWGYGRVVHYDESVSEITEFRRRLREILINGEAGVKVSPEEADRWLYQRIDQVYIARSPMWMPGIGLSMAGWSFARDLKTRMTISLPGGKFGGILIFPQYFALEFRFGRVLRLVVTRAVEELQSLIEKKPSRGNVYLDIPKNQLRHAQVFYHRLDQMLRTVSSIEPSPQALDDPRPAMES